MASIYLLKGTVKHYDWGGYSFIPQLLNISNPENKPFAEYWLGTHPLGISIVQKEEKEEPLTGMTDALSFLFKAQDVKEMLSIQVHPSKEAAEKEFARENEEGIAPDVPHRNYKDDNHKPEMLVAQSDFWLLHGFKAPEELQYTLLNVVELRELLPVYNASGYEGLYRHVMEMPQEEVNRILQPLIANLANCAEDEDCRNDEDYWAAKAAATFTKEGNIDRGIFSIYLFNIVHLKKGEGLFQSAGLPHAYLEGQCVEIMANSDNVLRGGLTTKHIDIKELMKHVKCGPTYPVILEGEMEEGEKIYKVPIADPSSVGFVLSSFELEAGETVSFTPSAVEVLLLTEGLMEADDDETTVRLQPGSPSAVVFPGREIFLAAAAKSVVYRASGSNAAVSTGVE